MTAEKLFIQGNSYSGKLLPLKIKKDGAIDWHDINHMDASKAVHEFADKNNLSIKVDDKDWNDTDGVLEDV